MTGEGGVARERDIDRWRKLEVWQMADDFTYDVYQVTRGFPQEELYGIASQLQRAAISVPTTIVEGYSRRRDRELVRFLEISLGSLGESKYLVHFSNRLHYLHESDYQGLSEGAGQLGQKLYRFYEKVKNTK
jgi:four helix bundle protein